MPNVDVPEEMVDMLGAARAYQANLDGDRHDPRHGREGSGAREVSHVTSHLTRRQQPAAAAPRRRHATTAGAGAAAAASAIARQAARHAWKNSRGDANDAVDRMIDSTGDVHEAMIAMQRAEMTLQLTVQVRNKLVQAYQDIMRMPI